MFFCLFIYFLSGVCLFVDNNHIKSYYAQLSPFKFENGLSTPLSNSILWNLPTYNNNHNKQNSNTVYVYNYGYLYYKYLKMYIFFLRSIDTRDVRWLRDSASLWPFLSSIAHLHIFILFNKHYPLLKAVTKAFIPLGCKKFPEMNNFCKDLFYYNPSPIATIYSSLN